jgi:hypothetical protein
LLFLLVVKVRRERANYVVSLSLLGLDTTEPVRPTSFANREKLLGDSPRAGEKYLAMPRIVRIEGSAPMLTCVAAEIGMA